MRHKRLPLIGLVVAPALVALGAFGHPDPHLNAAPTRVVLADVRCVTVDASTGAIADLDLGPGRFADYLTVLPDHQRFVFSDIQWNEHGGIALGRFADGKAKVTQLTHGHDDLFPCSSWDQKRIVFTRDHQVAVMDLASRKVRLVATTPREFQRLSPVYPVCWSECAWTRDDKWLLCEWRNPIHPEEPTSLWQVDPSGRTKPRKLRDWAGQPAVNPNDGTLAFASYPRGTWEERNEIWLGRFTSGRGIQVLRRLPFRAESNVAWSPDGARLAFVRYKGGTLRGELWIGDVAHGSLRRVAGPSERIGGQVSW